MALFQRFNNICIRYKRFVNQMSALKLFLLAVLSSASAVYFLYRSNLVGEKGENKSEVMMYSSFLVLYLLLLSGYIFIYRRPDNEDAAVAAANPPAEAIQLREARCFSNSFLHTSAMAFFFFVDEPLKSNPSGFVPAFCLAGYFHVLLLLRIFKLREDYGISDGFLAASFSLLHPMTKPSTYLAISLYLATVFLSGLRNIQLLQPPPPRQSGRCRTPPRQPRPQIPPPPLYHYAVQLCFLLAVKFLPR